MNETERLILENQQAILENLGEGVALKTKSIPKQILKTEQALAPKSDEMGYEGDLEETAVKLTLEIKKQNEDMIRRLESLTLKSDSKSGGKS